MPDSTTNKLSYSTIYSFLGEVKRKFSLTYFAVILLYFFFCYLMLKIMLQYIPYDTDVAFLRVKQDVIDVPFYKLAFFTHVYTTMTVLVAGFTQFSSVIRRKIPEVHRVSGWMYTVVVVLLAGPSGFYMGVYANGGIISQTAFCTLAVLWIFFTFMAVVKAIQRNFTSHRMFMICSFALTLSAITLRAWKFGIVYFLHPRPMDVYHIVSWLGWVPNLLVAVLIINKFNIKKMRKLIFLLPLFILFSCSKQDKNATGNNVDKKETVKEDAKSLDKKDNNGNSTGKIFGLYTGDFEALKYKETVEFVYSNKITISLDSTAGDTFYGHSVAAGNSRPFKGSYKLNNGIYNVEAAEPGDDKYDGKFSFAVYTDSIMGTWKANNTNLEVSERKYTLKRKEFRYSPDTELPEELAGALLYQKNQEDFDKGEYLTKDILKVNPSKKLLTKQDVENMHTGDLEVIRNSIFARHGYSFKTRKMRYIFDQYVEWYMPVSDDVRSQLTDIEQKNVELLKRYEEHSTKYYDAYGR